MMPWAAHTKSVRDSAPAQTSDRKEALQWIRAEISQAIYAKFLQYTFRILY